MVDLGRFGDAEHLGWRDKFAHMTMSVANKIKRDTNTVNSVVVALNADAGYKND